MHPILNTIPYHIHTNNDLYPHFVGGEQGADAFIQGMPLSAQNAESNWAAFYGSHGSVPPYGIAGGPFNSVCFTEAPTGEHKMHLKEPAFL